MAEQQTREITITRILDAPSDLVFKAWTEAEHLARWWGPEGFTVPSVESDPRPGGSFTIVMRGPDGVDHPTSGTYRVVEPPRLLIAESSVVAQDGTRLLEAVTTVTITDKGGKSELTVNARAVALVPDAVAMLGGMQAGWSQSLRRLDDLLTGAVDRQVVLARVFEAPRERVFEAWTTPEHVERWWGPTGFTVSIDEMEVRPGGTWRFTMHGPDGVDHPNLVVFDEVAPPELLVYEHRSMPGTDDPGSRVTVTFDDFAGMTALTLRMVFATAGDRDLVVEKYAAVEGGNQTLDRLGAHLASSAQG